MESLVHCSYCQEDTNIADWEANRGVCPHCGRAVDSFNQQMRHTRRNPLTSLRRRLEFYPVLQPRQVVVAAL